MRTRSSVAEPDTMGHSTPVSTTRMPLGGTRKPEPRIVTSVPGPPLVGENPMTRKGAMTWSGRGALTCAPPIATMTSPDCVPGDTVKRMVLGVTERTGTMRPDTVTLTAFRFEPKPDPLIETSEPGCASAGWTERMTGSASALQAQLNAKTTKRDIGKNDGTRLRMCFLLMISLSIPIVTI